MAVDCSTTRMLAVSSKRMVVLIVLRYSTAHSVHTQYCSGALHVSQPSVLGSPVSSVSSMLHTHYFVVRSWGAASPTVLLYAPHCAVAEWRDDAHSAALRSAVCSYRVEGRRRDADFTCF